MKLRRLAKSAFVLFAFSNAIACVHFYADMTTPAEAESKVGLAGDAGGTVAIADTRLPLCPSLSPALQNATDDAGTEYAEADSGYPVLVDNECGDPGAVCEYGTSSDRECNGVFMCQGTGKNVWTTRSHEHCFDNSACDPAAVMGMLDGKPCDLGPGATDADDAICNAIDGVCACTTGRGGTDVHPRMWVCARPVATCPLHRPNIGASCTEDLFCDYGSCTSKRGIAVVCKTGTWQESAVSCSN
jgi:hypothetical protein